MRGSFGADQATLDAYCDVWHGVDDIPGTEECKKSLGFVAVQPEVHKCCGSPCEERRLRNLRLEVACGRGVRVQGAARSLLPGERCEPTRLLLGRRRHARLKS